MSGLVLRLDGDRAVYEPGELLQGSVSWTAAFTPQKIEVRLYWKTAGKGTTDAVVVAVVDLGDRTPRMNDRQPFRFQLPHLPYSFSGRLVSLKWGIEVIAEAAGVSTHLEFVMAPGGRPVVLHEGDRAP